MSAQLAHGIRPARLSDETTVVALLEAEDLDAAFDPDEFIVAEGQGGGEVVGCARLRALDEETLELASLAVQPDRRNEGIGTALVQRALERASSPVQALCVEPGFFAHLGFETVEEVHPELEAKAEGRCGDRDIALMVWRNG